MPWFMIFPMLKTRPFGSTFKLRFVIAISKSHML
jgi:hypothetical protein